jgi:hypothetical protein
MPMVCPGCGVEVQENQKFCNHCGASMKGVTEPTEPVDTTSPAEAELPQLSDLPTAEITPREPLPDPTWAAPDAEDQTVVTESVEASPLPAGIVVAAAAIASTDDSSARLTVTEQIETPGSQGTLTEEMPALFDGHDDLAEYAPARQPFKLKLIFLLAFFGAIAMLMSVVADVTDIRTTRPAAGIITGVSTLEDLGTNLAVAGFIGAAAMVIGGLLACFGFRWGDGLAGGAGLGLFGWAAMAIGLAEFPIAVAESITRTSSESFTLTVTRDLGWWLIGSVGIVGVLVFLASLRSLSGGTHIALNPWVAAVGAVTMVVLAAGPLVPVGQASFADNFSSPTANIDLPTAYFAGRLAQVGLIAVAGVIGFLIVRPYGLGLAAGGISTAVWLWASSLGELGSRPVGIADRNPGALNTIPHGVTTVGMALSILLLIIAIVIATIQRQRVNTF